MCKLLIYFKNYKTKNSDVIIVQLIHNKYINMLRVKYMEQK